MDALRDMASACHRRAASRSDSSPESLSRIFQVNGPQYPNGLFTHEREKLSVARDPLSSRPMNRLLASLAASCAALVFAAAPALPPYVSLPVPVPPDEVNHSTYEQHEFTLRDKTEVHRGRYWTVYVDYTQKLGEDNRKALVAFIDSMRKAGWDVVMQDIPSNQRYY